MAKWINLAGLFVLAAWLLSSCSMNDDSPPSGGIYMGYATVLANDRGEFELIMDNNTIMEITVPMNPYPAEFEFRENQRVYISFLVLDERTVEGALYYSIQVNDIMEITSKEPVYSSQLGGPLVVLGNDPIDVSNKWFSMNHLTVIYDIATSNQNAHSIELLVDEDHQGADEDNIYVEIRHNANGDPRVRVERKVISFDIRKFLPEGKNSVNVHIQYTRYDGQVIRDYNNVYARKKAES